MPSVWQIPLRGVLLLLYGILFYRVIQEYHSTQLVWQLLGTS